MQITPIAKIYNDFDSKFAVPRQSGLVNSVKSKIIFEKEYASGEAFKGLEGYSHLWLIWEFDKNAHESNSEIPVLILTAWYIHTDSTVWTHSDIRLPSPYSPAYHLSHS